MHTYESFFGHLRTSWNDIKCFGYVKKSSESDSTNVLALKELSYLCSMYLHSSSSKLGQTVTPRMRYLRPTINVRLNLCTKSFSATIASIFAPLELFWKYIR